MKQLERKSKKQRNMQEKLMKKLLLVSNELKQHIKQNIRVIGAIPGVSQK